MPLTCRLATSSTAYTRGRVGRSVSQGNRSTTACPKSHGKHVTNKTYEPRSLHINDSPKRILPPRNCRCVSLALDVHPQQQNGVMA
eukprot:1492107-Amphidinium_carterae.1